MEEIKKILEKVRRDDEIRELKGERRWSDILEYRLEQFERSAELAEDHALTCNFSSLIEDLFSMGMNYHLLHEVLSEANKSNVLRDEEDRTIRNYVLRRKEGLKKKVEGTIRDFC